MDEFEEFKREIIEENGDVVHVEIRLSEMTPEGIPMVFKLKKSTDIMIYPTELLADMLGYCQQNYGDDLEDSGIKIYSISTEPPEEMQN